MTSETILRFQEAYDLGVQDGVFGTLRPADDVAEVVGYPMPAPTSDGYPYGLARTYLAGFDYGRDITRAERIPAAYLYQATSYEETQ